MIPRPSAIAAALALAALTTFAVPALGAEPGGYAPAARPEDRFVLLGDTVVRRDDSVKDLVVLDGDVTVAGTVSGDLVAVGGDVLVGGDVEGDLTTVLGRATLLPGASVGGDISYGDERPGIAGAASVGGKVRNDDWGDAFEAPWAAIGAVALWIAMSLSLLVFGVIAAGLAPNALEAANRAARESVWPSIGIGVAIAVGLPILALIAVITLVGIPFGVGAFAALLPLTGLAYVASSFILGRIVTSESTHPILAFMAGFGILRAIALIPFLGTVLWTATVILGLGALGIAAWRAGGADSPAGPA